MKPIKFNSNCKSNSYPSHFELLNSDYELFRGKYFTDKCLDLLKTNYSNSQLLLTHSATGGLEIIAKLLKLKIGDEVIMPSFTFVSTANAFVNAGATPVFVDIDINSLNLDIDLVEKAITSNTKAIVAMHYVGHPCDMDRLKSICNKYSIYLIEDAAMGFGTSYNGEPLGSIGDFGVISFDITKQISAIQGGLLLVNNKSFVEKSNEIYHNGTNRMLYENGDIPYYEWVGEGSKYQMNELNSAYLYEQLMNANETLSHRRKLSVMYFDSLKDLADKGYFNLMAQNLVSDNVHAFYLIANSKAERISLQNYLKDNLVEAFFHYVPLHTSSFGIKVGRYIGADLTVNISDSLLRLPFHAGVTDNDVKRISTLIGDFYNGE